VKTTWWHLAYLDHRGNGSQNHQSRWWVTVQSLHNKIIYFSHLRAQKEAYWDYTPSIKVTAKHLVALGRHVKEFTARRRSLGAELSRKIAWRAQRASAQEVSIIFHDILDVTLCTVRILHYGHEHCFPLPSFTSPIHPRIRPLLLFILSWSA